MGKNRLEAFSDGVLAVIITIMVLELKPPHGAEWQDLVPLFRPLRGYLLSFIYIGIYWSNHHHLASTIKHVNGRVLWANLHLLFWLSLFPFLTAWTGEFPEAALPAATYGVVLLCAALAYLVLQQSIIGAGGTLAAMIGHDLKGRLSPLLYLAGIGLAFVRPWASEATYALVAAIWIVPDRRIERATRTTNP
jgi:uncharacterized membrane protein